MRYNEFGENTPNVFYLNQPFHFFKKLFLLSKYFFFSVEYFEKVGG